MKTPKQQIVFRKSILALSVLLSIGAAYASEEEVLQLTRNESSVSAGVGVAGGGIKGRSIFGQYNGLRNDDANLLLNIDFIKLNDATGLWTIFDGRNLGLDNRELTFTQNKQGDWKYSLGYNEITHHDIRTINTGLQNPQTTTPNVVSLAAPGTGTDINPQLRREAVNLEAEKWLTPSLLLETSFKNEDKKGMRLSGAGIACSTGGVFTGYSRFTCGNAGALLMLPEPVNTTTKQIDVKLNYSGDKYLLSGGYYGTFFSNANGSLHPAVNGNLFNPNGTGLNPGATGLQGYLQQAIALQPDNQSHQLFVSGNYALTPTTRSTFKYAYTHATQNDSYGSMGLTGAPIGVGNLGGVVDTNLVQLGLTSHPLPKLALLANARYEDKSDKTPLAAYNANAAGAQYVNLLSSSKKLNGKLEASYQLPSQTRATLGVDYATVQRITPPSLSDPAAADLSLGLGGLRAKTQETSYRAELRHTFTDTLEGAASYVNSRRTGDSWTLYNTSGTLPLTMLDRNRDKGKVSADWAPTNKFSLQLSLEAGKDTYSGPIGAGMRDTSMNSYGIDASYALSVNWKLTGYLNRNNQTLNVNHGPAYLAELDDNNTTLGFGVVGKPSSLLDVGGNLSYMNDINHYNQSYANGTGIPGISLPDVKYRVTNLKLYGKYALEKNADVRVDLVYQNASLNEWTWANNGTQFAYSDNTTVTLQPNQSVTFVGANYIYKFR